MTIRNELALLRHVGLLVAVGDHGSISAAATVLGTTQSAVTKGLQRAEEDFGELLFERTSKGVVPTRLGRTVLEHARLISRQSREAVNAVSNLSGAPGTVLVGAGASFLDALLPQAIAAVVTRHPLTQIRLRVEPVASLITLLREGELDLLFVSEQPGIGSMADIDWRPVIKNEMDVVARIEHPLTLQKAVSVDDLHRYGWILGRDGDPQKRYLESVFRSAGLAPPNVAIETESRAVAMQIVRQSDLLTLAPNTRTYIDRTDIARVNCPAATWIRQAGIVVRKGCILPPAGNWLIEEIESMRNTYDPT